ncbi:MAG: transketolase, partial [Rhodospirillales bacterium]|nr:transketolase [Rhodospirillales bacterium]
LRDAPGAEAVLIASGSEVAVAMAASDLLAGDGISTRVVSLPCWQLFAAQDEAYREQILGGDTLRVGIEAATRFGWTRWLGHDGEFVGMTGFGASAPASDLFPHFGITEEAVAERVRARLGRG